MASKKKQTSQSSAGLPGLDLTEIERLLAFMTKHNLELFEYALGDLRIALRRSGGEAPERPAPRAVAPAPVAAAAAAPAAPAAAPADDTHTIKSPIVGTFYGSPNPDSPAFVKVGERVKAGQVVCIVEAMKLMNEIESDVSGEVIRILAENAQPVEYGQPLYVIRPDGKK